MSKGNYDLLLDSLDPFRDTKTKTITKRASGNNSFAVGTKTRREADKVINTILATGLIAMFVIGSIIVLQVLIDIVA